MNIVEFVALFVLIGDRWGWQGAFFYALAMLLRPYVSGVLNEFFYGEVEEE